MATLKVFSLLILLGASAFLSGCMSTHQSATTVTSPDQSTELVRLDSVRMMQHLKAFQDIAAKHAGNRAVGTSGGMATAEYLLREANKAGIEPEMISFENREKKFGHNIIAEIKGKNINEAVIVGAHYDSVKTGPGINDNGSGTALLLELMHHYAKPENKPNYTIYFAFWDSEEEGIGGSQDFVKRLQPSQLEHILAYINVDMVGTQNPEILIADADKSSVNEMESMLKKRGMAKEDYLPLIDGLRSVPSHTGDLLLEQKLKQFFQQRKLKIKEDVSTLTASDTLPFLGKVPVTSIIFFNEQLKGDVLEFAPCYHQACDTIEKVDPKSLDLAGDAVLYLLSELQNQ